MMQRWASLKEERLHSSVIMLYDCQIYYKRKNAVSHNPELY